MAAQHAVLLLLWCGVCVYGAAAASVVANVSAASAEECDVSKCPPGPCTRAYFWEQRSECVFLNCSDDAACERLIEGLSQSARVQISASPRTSSPPGPPGPHTNISTTTSSSTKDLQPQRASSPEPRPSQTTANGRQGQAAPPPIMTHNGTSPNGHPDVQAGDSSSPGIQTDVQAGDSSPGVQAGDSSSPGVQTDVQAGDSSPGVKAGDSSSPGVQTDVQAGDSSPGVKAGDSSSPDVQTGDSASPGVQTGVKAGDSSSPGVQTDVQAGTSSPDDLHPAQNTSITPTSPNKAPTAITAAPTAGTTFKSTSASTRPPRPATTPKPRASTRHATFIPALLSSAPSPGVVQLTLGRDRAAVEAAGGSLTSHVMNTSSLLAALIFGLLFFSVTVALFLRHAYESYKRRDYTQVDYLINGMYSDSGL